MRRSILIERWVLPFHLASLMSVPLAAWYVLPRAVYSLNLSRPLIASNRILRIFRSATRHILVALREQLCQAFPHLWAVIRAGSASSCDARDAVERERCRW